MWKKTWTLMAKSIIVTSLLSKKQVPIELWGFNHNLRWDFMIWIILCHWYAPRFAMALWWQVRCKHWHLHLPFTLDWFFVLMNFPSKVRSHTVIRCIYRAMHPVTQPHHLGFNLRERRFPTSYVKIKGANSLWSMVWKQNNALTSAKMSCGLQIWMAESQ